MALVDELTALLEQWGLASLAPMIVDGQVEGKDPLTILTELRATPEYKVRFPAMQGLQKAVAAGGRAVPITEANYMDMERAYRQALQDSGLPPNMFDTPDDFKRLIENDVNPDEVRYRVAAAKQAVNATDPNVRNQLQSLYGISTTDLMAYALDPARNSDYIKKLATTATLSGYGVSAGLGGVKNWESYGMDAINQGMDDSELRTAVANARQVAVEQQRLAGIEGEQFTTNDALDISIRKDANKALASQRRAQREKARFSGTQGISTGSLRRTGL